MSSAVIGLVRSHAVAALLAAVAIGVLALAATGGHEPAAASHPKVVGGELYLPGAAHVAGAAGTNWRSDLEIFNVGPTAASYQIALLPQNRPNPSPATVSFNLGPRRSVRYGDLISSLFNASGSAALRITSGAGSLMANLRTYNQTAQGTYGQFISALDPAHALRRGDVGRLIQLTHNRSDSSGYRTNIGYLNLSGTQYWLTINYYLANGNQLGTNTVQLQPYGFTQSNAAFNAVTSGDVADGYVTVQAYHQDALYLAYASVVDNRTGDPVYIPAQVVDNGGPANATPTPQGPTSSPTRTPTSRPATATPTRTPTQSGPLPNLAPAVFTGWSDALVLSSVQGTTTSGNLVGGAPTYVDVGVGNFGDGTVVLPANSNVVAIDLDGTFLGNLSIGPSPLTLQSGFGVTWTDVTINNITAGPHTVTMRIDPEGRFAESDETDNQYSVSGTWSGRKARLPAAAVAGDPADRVFLWRDAHRAPRGAEPSTTAAKASGTPIYILAAANAAGAGGTQWRTDVEVHNPGSGQASFEIALLATNQANPNPQTINATLAAGRSRRFQNILASQFGFSGSAALRVTPLSGSVMVTSRTYNLTPGGTFGQFIGGIPESEALVTSEEAALIQLSHQTGGSGGARTNVGFVNTSGTTVVVVLEVFRADGTSLGTRQWSVPPYGHLQVNRVIGQYTGASITDAFGIVRSTTPGARFLAYASVVDNDTGDPILVPAVRTSASAATPTPTIPAGEPLPPLDVADFMSDWFGSTPGSGSFPSLEGAVQDWQTSGFSSLLNEIRDSDPGIVSVSGTTITANWGNGTTLPGGTVASGSMQLSFSNLVNNTSRVRFHVTGSASTFRLDSTSLGVDNMQGDLDLMRIQGGHLSGSVTFSAGGNKSGNSVTGDLDVDTSLCEHYPVGGSITFSYEGETHTIEIPDTCDGEYDYSGPDATPTPHVSPTPTPGTGDLAFRLTWSGNPNTDYDLHVIEPSGEEVYYGNSTSDTGGQLDIDCVCSNCTSPIENIFWPTGTAPHGTFRYWVDVFSTCGQSGSRSCRLQVLVNGAVVRTHDLNLSSGESQQYTYQY